MITTVGSVANLSPNDYHLLSCISNYYRLAHYYVATNDLFDECEKSF